MSLKTRLKKLEPTYKKAWEDAWLAVLDPPEADTLYYKMEDHKHHLTSLSEAELKDADARFRKDQERTPELVIWEDAELREWLERAGRWLDDRGLDLDSPDYSLWPWQAPPPPGIPPGVVSALRREAYRYGEFAGAYATWFVNVLLAEGFKEAIEEHEAAKDE